MLIAYGEKKSRVSKPARTLFFTIGVCLAVTLLTGCGAKSDSRQALLDIYGQASQLDSFITRTSLIVDVLSTIDLENNPNIFSGLNDTIEDCKESADQAEVVIEQMLETAKAIGSIDIGEAVDALAMEVKDAIGEVREIISYMIAVDGALTPLKEAKAAILAMGTVELEDDPNVLIQRVDIILNTRDLVFSKLEEVCVPPIAQGLHDALATLINDFYFEIRKWKIIVVDSSPEGDTERENNQDLIKGNYFRELNELERGLKINNLEDSLERLQSLIYSHLAVYSKEEAE